MASITYLLAVRSIFVATTLLANAEMAVLAAPRSLTASSTAESSSSLSCTNTSALLRHNEMLRAAARLVRTRSRSHGTILPENISNVVMCDYTVCVAAADPASRRQVLCECEFEGRVFSDACVRSGGQVCAAITYIHGHRYANRSYDITTNRLACIGDTCRNLTQLRALENETCDIAAKNMQQQPPYAKCYPGHATCTHIQGPAGAHIAAIVIGVAFALIVVAIAIAAFQDLLEPVDRCRRPRYEGL
eukprot:UC1_evm1s1735